MKMDCNFNEHCTTVPIPLPCLNYCTERILSKSTPEEKQLILGLNKQLTEKIFSLYNSTTINSYYDLERKLNGDEVEILRKTFLGLNQFQLNYFLKEQYEKKDLINIIKRLKLDQDENDNLTLR